MKTKMWYSWVVSCGMALCLWFGGVMLVSTPTSGQEVALTLLTCGSAPRSVVLSSCFDNGVNCTGVCGKTVYADQKCNTIALSPDGSCGETSGTVAKSTYTAPCKYSSYYLPIIGRVIHCTCPSEDSSTYVLVPPPPPPAPAPTGPGTTCSMTYQV